MKDEVDQLLAEIEGQVIGLDLETTGLNPRQDSIEGVAVAIKGGNEFYIDLTKPEWPYRKTLQRLQAIDNKPKLVAIHNAKFDLAFLRFAGVEISAPTACTMTGSILLDEERFTHKLDTLSKERFGEGKAADYKDVGTLWGPSMLDYAKKDAVLHYRLWDEWQEESLETQRLSKIFWDLEMPVLRHCMEMEDYGIDIDMEHVLTFRRRTKERLKKVQEQVYEVAGERFLISSNKILSHLLFDKMGISTKYTFETKNEGVYSTSEAVMSAIASQHELPKLILEYRRLIKILGTYTDPIINTHVQDDGRIHANFRQVGTTSGRFACREPNMQNWGADDPDGIRRAVYAPDGYKLIQADYGQIELRIAAVICKEPVMLKAIREGIDLHQYSADLWNVPRKDAKACNFGFIFGMSAKRFAAKTGVTKERARYLRDLFFQTYKTFKPYYGKVHQSLVERGYVKTLIGRRRRFTDYHNFPIECYDCKENYKLHTIKCSKCRQKTSRRWCGAAINFPIQGSAADLLKIAFRNFMDLIHDLRDEQPGIGWDRVHVISLIHDEMLVKAPDSLALKVKHLLSDTMESAMDIGVPITADSMIIRNWGECKKSDEARIIEYLQDGTSLEEMTMLMSHVGQEKLATLEDRYYSWTKMASKTQLRNAVNAELT